MANDDGKIHVFPVRVYYEDTDSGGIVYYANYLRFAERARTEFLRSIGVNHIQMRDEDGLGFAVRRCHADYLRPAHLDDLLEVHTRIEAVKGASLSAQQTVKKDGETLVDMELLLACMDARGRAARLPKNVRSRLDDYIGQKTDVKSEEKADA